ncbi:MAG: NUDIX domain-containing protein, partial [Pseudonocardia sp.]|nr:NUDIX domain-containing protein [Pseudonocardia sp.]
GATEWPRLLALEYEPMFRGIHGDDVEDADAHAEQFRTEQRPFLGRAATMGPTGGTGTNFDTDPGIGRGIANASQRLMPLFNPFGLMRQYQQQRFGAVLAGYLQPDAVVVELDEALERRDRDAAVARRRGLPEVAELLDDLGVWAALSGVDAICMPVRQVDRQYLVLNRAAMAVETDEPTIDKRAGLHIGCDCGQRHFGTYGAAGMLLTHVDADGVRWVLMQQRSSALADAGAWALPGGAILQRETARHTAMRAAWQQAGIDQSAYVVRGSYVDDHGPWAYTTIWAETDRRLATTSGRRSAELRWVRLDRLHELPLLPGFGASWPAVRATLLDVDGGPFASGDDHVSTESPGGPGPSSTVAEGSGDDIAPTAGSGRASSSDTAVPSEPEHAGQPRAPPWLARWLGWIAGRWVARTVTSAARRTWSSRWGRRLLRVALVLGPAALLVLGPLAGTAHAAAYYPTVSVFAGLPTGVAVAAGVMLAAAVSAVAPFVRWWWRLRPTRGPPDPAKLAAPKVSLGALRLAVPVLYAPAVAGFWYGLITLLGPAGGVLGILGTGFGALGLTMVRDGFAGDVRGAEFRGERTDDDPAELIEAQKYLRGAVGRLLIWPFGSRVIKGPGYWNRALAVTERLSGTPATDRPARSLRRWTLTLTLLLAVTTVLQRGAGPAPVALPASAVTPVNDPAAEHRLVGEFLRAGFTERTDPARGRLLVLPDPRGNLVIGALPDRVMTLTDELRGLTYTIEHRAYLNELYWPDFLSPDDGAANPAQIAKAWHERTDQPRDSAGGIGYYLRPDSGQPIALLVEYTPVGAELIQSQPVDPGYAAATPRLARGGYAGFSGVLARVIPAVVRLREPDGTAVGSGVIIDPNGTILT